MPTLRPAAARRGRRFRTAAAVTAVAAAWALTGCGNIIDAPQGD